jgi:hypothetical protein
MTTAEAEEDGIDLDLDDVRKLVDRAARAAG